MEKMQESQFGSQSEEKGLGFCATLSDSGTQSKRSSHLKDFLPLIEKASIAWVDIKVDDLQKEALEIATKVGFSQEITKQLLTRSMEPSPKQWSSYFFWDSGFHRNPNLSFRYSRTRSFQFLMFRLPFST